MLNLRDCVTTENLMEFAQRLKQRRFKPGFDGMTAAAALFWLQINGERLCKDIRNGQYAPMPAMGFIMAKQNGGYRQLARLTALDSIVQMYLSDALSAESEKLLSPNSYAYRPGLGVGTALNRYCMLANEFTYAAKLDPEACYDNIDHDVLRATLRASLPADDAFIDLLLRCAAMPLYTEGQILARERGILQGSPLSPLLCNLYYHPLDQCLTNREIPFIRYADDLILFGNTLDKCRTDVDFAAGYIVDELHLRINSRKKLVCACVDMQFLGHRFERDRRGFIALSASDSAEGAYYTWKQTQMRNTHRTLDILSNGILRQKDFSLLFDGETQTSDIPLKALDVINIYSSVILDSGFLKRAMENNLCINVFDEHGELEGRFIPNAPLKSPMVTHAQLQSYFDTEMRLYLARQFVRASIHNLRLVIRYYHKTAPQDFYVMTLDEINAIDKQIKSCEDYENLLLLEARARKEYYKCFDFFIKSEDFVFEKRTRRPPENEINALLSFGNTVLYSTIAIRINKSPLDIRVGYLHATNSCRTESLNLDVAEIFKPLIVDRVIFTLINMRSIKKEHFQTEQNDAVYLNEAGKRVFLRAFYAKLDEGLTLKDRYFTYSMLLDEEVRKLVRHFRSGEPYKAYRQVR